MLRVSSFYCLVLLVASCALAACSSNPSGPSSIVIPGPDEPIVYSKHIQPIFANGCSGSGCHMNGDNFSGMNLDSWEHVMAGTPDYGAEIVPYNAAKSHLFQHINTDTTFAPVALPHMPYGRDPLPADQIATIRRWIEEGAKNDDGQVALAGDSRPRVFVTAQADDYVSVIDRDTRYLARYIPVGTITGGAPESPHNIVMSPDNNYFYVNLIVAGTVEKYDAHTFEKLGMVHTGLSPAQIAVTHDGSTLYVSNFDQTLTQHFITRVNAATMTMIDTIFDVGLAPHGVTLSPDEKYVYTMNQLGDDIAEVNTKTLEVTRRIPLSPGSPLPPGTAPTMQPYQSVFSPDGKELWITCKASSEVRVVDIASGTVVDSIRVGLNPLIPQLTPDGTQLWVPNHGDSSISIISLATHQIVGTVQHLSKQPHAVVFTPDGTTAFVSCENQKGDQHHATLGSSRTPGYVDVVDVASHQVTRKIEVGSFAAGIATGS